MIEVRARGKAELVGLEIEALAADHAGGTASLRKPRDQLRAHGRVGMCLRPGEHGEGQRQQRVAGQDRGPLVEGLVHGGPAAAQVVVVHGGQVVVHQRVAVHALESRGGRQRGLARHAEQTRALEHQERAQPLAAAERCMAHGCCQPGRRALPFRPVQQAGQMPFDKLGRLR